MLNETRILFDKYLERVAQLNGVKDVTKTFSATPSVEQTLENKIQESSEFLRRINMIGVRDLSGEKLRLGISGTIAGRTNVANGPRQPRDLSAIDPQGYECKFTEFDTALPYSKLDQWAKFRDFQVRVRNAIVRGQALDRIMVGWNGTSAAAATDRDTYPLLQDVNIGWLQHYRTNAPARVLDEVEAASGVVNVGPAGDYANLDALVMDAKQNLIDSWHRKNPELVCILGDGLLHDKYFPLVNKEEAPTEKLALDLVISQKRVGGLQAVAVPFFPDNTILITSLSNLSIYWQEERRRRHIREEPDYNRVANYESTNEAYVVEDYGFGCLIENIVIGDFSE